MGSTGALTRGSEGIAAVTTNLQRQFPEAVVWFGAYTLHWWALVPGSRWGYLLEAITPEQLEQELSEYLLGP